MGRSLRVTTAGVWRHVCTSSAGGIDIVRDAEDRARLLRIIAYVVAKHGWELAMYVLMSSHYHLVLRTAEPDIDAGMHVINGFYARTFNSRHRRRGHLFGARYDARAIETEEHALNVAAYVPLNPMRAGATIGVRPKPWFLIDDWVLTLFDERDVEAARRRYRAFVTAIAMAEAAVSRTPGPLLPVPGT